jgi:hypothetical protein
MAILKNSSCRVCEKFPELTKFCIACCARAAHGAANFAGAAAPPNQSRLLDVISARRFHYNRGNSCEK